MLRFLFRLPSSWPQKFLGWCTCGTKATIVGERAPGKAQAERTRQALYAGMSAAFSSKGKLNNASILIFRPVLFGSVIPPFDHIKVQPIVLDYGEHSNELIGPSGLHATSNALVIFNRPSTEQVTVYLLETIIITEGTHRKDIAMQCETAIADTPGRSNEGAAA